MSSLEDLAKEVKAAQEIIDRVSAMLRDAGRSASVEVKNATSRTLHTRINDDGHKHGGFAPSAPAMTIAAGQTDVFGTRSNEGSVLTGTTGSVFYAVDDEGTMWHIRWAIPWAGENEVQASVSGPHADWYVSWIVPVGGNKKVALEYMLTEKATVGPADDEWRPCGACKALCYRLEDGKCPGHTGQGLPVKVGEGINQRVVYPTINLAHQPAGEVFTLSHTEPGPGREGGWRKCRHCQLLFWDGAGRGLCPGRGASRPHVADPGGFEYILQFDTPPRSSQQNDWRFCTKCFVLFFLPQNADGDCAGGGAHRAHTNNYLINRVAPA